MNFFAEHWLDIVTTVLGLVYIALEYRASIALWIVGIIMPALDIYLYYSHGLYGDAGMAVYYTAAAVYGYIVWKFGKKGRQQGTRNAHIAFPPKKNTACRDFFSQLPCGQPITFWSITQIPLFRCLTVSPMP